MGFQLAQGGLPRSSWASSSSECGAVESGSWVILYFWQARGVASVFECSSWNEGCANFDVDIGGDLGNGGRA